MDGNTTLAPSAPRRKKKMMPPEADESIVNTEMDSSADSATSGPVTDAAEQPAIDPARVIEAILMAADSPMTSAKIASVLGIGSARDVKKHIDSLNEDYDARGMSFRIEEIAGGFQILTRPEYNAWLTKMLRVRQETKLTPAAMETLAIIAYKQPCTRAEVESIRGVAAGDGVNRLRELNLVKIVGRAEDLGRPLLYGTTKKFLEVFGLPSLEDLPQVEALRPPKPKNETATEEAPAPVAERSISPPETMDESDDAKPGLQLVRDEDERRDDA